MVITGKDAATYAAQLTEGTKELLKRYPTMRLDVYPTHRTVQVPQRVLDNTLKNATAAHTAEGGLAVDGALAGYPFPIPKTGYEVMWNHLRYIDARTIERLHPREFRQKRGVRVIAQAVHAQCRTAAAGEI